MASYVGYNSKFIDIDLNKNISLNFQILPSSVMNEELIVYARKKDGNISS